MGKNRPFLLSRQDELVILGRSQWSNNTKEAEYYQMDNISMDVTKQENGSYILGGVNINTAEQFQRKTDSWATAYDGLQHPQSIGVDRNGTGRKEFIATIGQKGDYLFLYIQNAETGAVQTYQLGDTWIGGLPMWRVDNHLAITAGDYDGDGRDSIIVFVSGTGNNVALWEFYPDPYADSWGRSRILYLSNVLVETTFQEADSSETWKPTVSLTTGDFNGDGRDQLAFAAGEGAESVLVGLDHGHQHVEPVKLHIHAKDSHPGTGVVIDRHRVRDDEFLDSVLVEIRFAPVPVAGLHRLDVPVG